MAEDEPLVEIQTDKATVEIPSPYAGTVLKIVVPEGEVAPVGARLVVIGEPGEAIDEPTPEAPSDTVSQGARVRRRRPPCPDRAQATPLVRKIAAELGVDLATVSATGPGGRITEDDVRAAAGGGRRRTGRREPLRGIRRVIAEHMSRAHSEVPAVTWVEECDFENVELDRLLATVVKAVASSLAEFPELNARLDGDSIVYLDRYDIGVAVQTEQGLVVPVVRGADGSDGRGDRCRDPPPRGGCACRDARCAELRGSTFTVTSAGKLAGLFQTPIVNHPEVAILSIGRIGRASGRSRRRGRRATHGDDRRHVRSPGRRRRPCRGVRARGDRSARGVDREPWTKRGQTRGV